MIRESKKDQAVRAMIDKMFEIAGHSLRYDDVVGRKDYWFQEYTMTETQRDEWKAWSIAYLKKRRFLRPNLEWAWLDLYCGLKTREDENTNGETV